MDLWPSGMIKIITMLLVSQDNFFEDNPNLWGDITHKWVLNVPNMSTLFFP
jgi:hypothetical protein